jgi:hypothetical protein
MEQIKNSQEFEYLVDAKKVKYILWKKIVSDQQDFSIFVKKHKQGIMIEDYSLINSEKPGECIKRYIELKNINWITWNVFNLTDEEGDELYKELLVKNI